MHIELTPDDEKFINKSVEQGHYPTAAKAVEAAVRHARMEYEKKYERLMAALKKGDDDIAAGRVVPLTPELLEEIMQEAKNHAANGGEFDPDVIPQ